MGESARESMPLCLYVFIDFGRSQGYGTQTHSVARQPEPEHEEDERREAFCWYIFVNFLKRTEGAVGERGEGADERKEEDITALEKERRGEERRKQSALAE